MAYTAGFSVNVGDPTKATDISTLAANDDFLKTAIDKIMVDSATPTFALVDGVTATTQSASNNSTKLATTAYADAAGTSLSGSTDDTIVTVTGANALQGEANLTFNSSNVLAVSGTLTTTGAATLASLVCTAAGTFGGGYGSTGATISTLGVGQFNGALTTDGAFTAASLDISGNADIDGTVSLGVGSTVIPPSFTAASESAKKIIPVMLDDPSTIWDLQAFLQASRNTSWWVELGAPPIHGAMWINEAQTELVWWNLDTNAQYMGFDTGGSAYNDKTAVGQSDISDLAFLDGVLYVTRENAKGMSIIDFVRDGVTGYETNNTLMAGDIGDRNTNNVWTQYRVMAVYDLTMVSVDAIRDPSLVDAFGRPKHWWIVGSSATLKKYSIYNPIADAIYDGIHAHASNVVAVAPSGPYAYLRNDSGAFDYLFLMPSIFAIYADDPAPDGYMFISSDNAGDPGFGETPWSSSVVIQDAVWMDDAGPDGEPIVAVGQDEGLTFAIVKGGPYDSSAFNMNADFASPLQVGKCFASYPLEGLADVSGSGNTLTDQGSVSFATAGVIGKGATFDGTGTNYLVSGTSLGAMGQFGYMMFWFKSASASNPSAIEYIVELADVTNDRWRVYANTDGTISLQLTDDGGSTHDTLTTVGDFYDGTWHHVAAYYDLSPALDQYLMIDGQVVAKDDGTVTAAVAAGNFDRISFGGSYAGASLYTGMIDQFVCGGSNEMSSYPGGVGSGGGPNFLNCARWEQQRGRRALQSGITADDALSNADVNSVRADQASKHWIICTADNNITLLDQFGVAILQDAVPSGTLRDAAVWTNDGQDIPSYAIAGSSDVELVQQARRILG